MTGTAAPQIIVPRRGREFAKDYNTINFDDSVSTAVAKWESWLAARLGTRLTQHYPNREWWINVNTEGGLVIVGCPDVSPTHGYHILFDHPKEGQRSANDIEEMMQGVGGEILERGRITRGRTTEEAVEAVARNFRDEVVGLDHG